MRIGVVVDTSCDLPQEFLREYGIRVLPGLIRVDSTVFTDQREPDATLAFYQQQFGDRTHSAETYPYSVEEIQKLFLERLVLDFDHIACIAIWSQRSKVYEHMMRASFGVLSSYRPLRARAGLGGSFSMRVLDSRTLFAGIGVQAAEAALLAREGRSFHDVVTQTGQLAASTAAYLVPADLGYIRTRAVRRGESSVGLAAYLIGQALGIRPIIGLYDGQTRPVAKLPGYEAAVTRLLRALAQAVEQGRVTSRHVCLSYGGAPQIVSGMDGYAELDAACRKHGLRLMVSIMSVAAAVNVGAGALSVAYAGPALEF